MKHLLAAVGVLAGLGAGASHPAVDERVMAVADYSHWAQATKGPVKISPRLWMLCRPPTPAEQKELDEFNRKNPHSDGYMRVYMNPLARTPLLSGTTFPPGSVLVKEKMIGPDTGLIARAVMTKHKKGWNPKTGDWEFYVLSREMKVEDVKASACISCHESRAKSNWVFGSYIQRKISR